jgi:hypothetical protein
MARPARFDAASDTEFVTLGTYEDMTKKIAANTRSVNHYSFQHMVRERIKIRSLILDSYIFISRHPDQLTLESRMKTWWKPFETKCNAQFFKCTVVDSQ